MPGTPAPSGTAVPGSAPAAVERDVVLEHLAPDDRAHGEIDAAFHAKYDRYGSKIVATVVGPEAAAVTLRLDPAPSPSSA